MNKHSHASGNAVLEPLDYLAPVVPEACPACANDNAEYIGQLGNLLHFRCGCCGWTFSIEAHPGD